MLRHNYSFEALGTWWTIETNEELSVDLKQSIQKRIETFDSVYSRFKKDSLVSQVAARAGAYTFPLDAEKLIGFYKTLYTLTDGKVTPLIGETLSRAGYDLEYSFKQLPQKPVYEWDDVMHWEGRKLTTSMPILLDFGAAGKGYLVDIISTLLDENDVANYVVDASGDLRHKGQVENRVGLEDPFNIERVIGVVDVQNRSLCASATNRRAWGGGMHHIFNPETMHPAEDIIATWVIADEAMVADGIATALFFCDPKVMSRDYDYEFVRLHGNGSIEFSTFFKDKLFLEAEGL